jgi:LAO/AO transport system kinase
VSSAAAAPDLERLVARDKRALGRAISWCEDGRPQSAAARAELVAALAAHPERRRARLVGVTGPPASGKSSLIAELAVRLVTSHPELAVAVLAVDPSSPRSGGALLGDRVRVRFPPGDRRLFFRSQATALELGGLGRHTFPVCRVLQHLFDCVLVETVGVGQSEVDVHRLADHTILVLPPAWGDAVQLMKAGIMEVPDSVVLSKQDLEPGWEAGAAARAGAEPTAGGGGAGAALPGGGSAVLAAALERAPRAIRVHRVSAHTGSGLEPLLAEVWSVVSQGGGGEEAPLERREAFFFGRWVQSEYGRSGLTALADRGIDLDRFVRDAGGYDGAQAAFPASYRRWLRD